MKLGIWDWGLERKGATDDGDKHIAAGDHYCRSQWGRKTTFARQYLPNEGGCSIFVNADLIAEGLSPFNPAAAAVRAGRIMLREIDEHFRNGENFAFETTLSGRVYLRRIGQWQRNGYSVKLMFLALPTPDAAIERVARRVRQGGHDIPDQVIIRRFHAGLYNLEHRYKPVVDSWAEYDNSGSKPILTARGSQHA